MTETKVFDLNGELLAEGNRVKNEWMEASGDLICWEGTVTAITDPEGELDEGRMIAINPKVYVQWEQVEDGDEEAVDTDYIGGQYAGADPEYQTEELELVK